MLICSGSKINTLGYNDCCVGCHDKQEAGIRGVPGEDPVFYSLTGGLRVSSFTIKVFPMQSTAEYSSDSGASDRGNADGIQRI